MVSVSKMAAIGLCFEQAREKPSPSMTLDPRYLFLLILPFWFLISFLIAQIGGWGELSRYYRAGNPFDGRRWRFRSGQMRLTTHYNGCLTLGVNSYGFYLAVFFLFRAGHPPLFIPWQDIFVKTGKILWWPWTEFRFRQAPSVYLKIYGGLGETIKSEAGTSWAGERSF